MSTENIQASLDTVQAEFDADLEKGFRGARVDPNPNSAYSQETDPTTSPRAGRLGDSRFLIDEYMDENNPDADKNHTRQGIVDGSPSQVADSTQVVGPQSVVARAAGAGGTTTFTETAQFDGSAASAKVTLDTALTGDAANNRTLTVRNVTKELDMFALTTTATIAAGTATTIPVNGAATNREVSSGDKFSLVETTAGTGVARSVGTVEFTVTQAA